MKIKKIIIHNFRSIINLEIMCNDYTLLVGANNAGKSNIIDSLRIYFDDLKWNSDDFPKKNADGNDSWVSIEFLLTEDEQNTLAEIHKNKDNFSLILKKYFISDKARPNQNNIYAIINGEEENNLFSEAYKVSNVKLGNIIYIPAITNVNDHMKTSGPSAFRNLLNFVLRKIANNSKAFTEIKSAFDTFNNEARGKNGFLSAITEPINEAMNEWGIQFDLLINSISTDDISKNLIKPLFKDSMLGQNELELDRFGNGFQRAVIYELIKLSSSLKEETKQVKKSFSPDFNLILFEEPEAFLHPTQQEILSYNLRKIGNEMNQQVIISTHSPLFIGKNSDQICNIIRLERINGNTIAYQLTRQNQVNLFSKGLDLKEKLKKTDFINIDFDNDDNNMQYEKFRYQLWLDSDKASMFFAEKVLLVEGTSEKALFNYLLATYWDDLLKYKILVVDTFGKFNMHRFMQFLNYFGIPHGIILDDDCNINRKKIPHKKINEYIKIQKNEFTISDPYFIHDCIEKYLDIEKPSRNDLKPLNILNSLHNNTITESKIKELRSIFCQVLGIQDNNLTNN